MKNSFYKKIWSIANEHIENGNMLLSKRPDSYLSDLWPTYYSKAKGCAVWDLKGKKFFDLCMMGVGTNVLGYSNTEINKEVKKAVNESNMSTLNSFHEVELAKKLKKIHPWADSVKFARTGGEANAIAVRIARASSNTDKIAICGYHGWHDWDLALNNKNKKEFSTHHIKGIPDRNGVPSVLSKLIFAFNYNDIDHLKYLIEKKNIKIVKMEVERNIKPKNNFLNKVRSLCSKHKVILIFDECTTGFRETLGGLHKRYKVNPDICIFGKALGNGYPITAIIGKKKIMKYTKNTFISSTFWTDRIGSVAALKTIDIIEKKKTFKKILLISSEIKKNWINIAKKNDLEIEIFGIDSILKFKFKSKDNNLYKGIITYLMLKKGFLANTTIYVSIAHTKNILHKYFKELDNIFSIIKKIEKKIIPKNKFKIKLPISDFKRFN